MVTLERQPELSSVSHLKFVSNFKTNNVVPVLKGIIKLLFTYGLLERAGPASYKI
jgi:hypothetical protein